MFGAPRSGGLQTAQAPQLLRMGLAALGALLLTGLFACSSGGSEDSKGGGASPVISSFVATPTTITRGQSSTLSWTVSNATSTSIDNGVGTVTGASVNVSPQNTTSYTLTATNSNGNATSVATVTVNAPVADNATGAFNTNTSGTIATPLGAKITVPMYAVPPTPTGGTGTMTFSLEKVAMSMPTLPAGETVTTDVYRLGPEGFTMARPVMVTLPVSGERQGNLVRLYRVDPTTNQAVLIPSTYDQATHTVNGPALKFSPWFGTYGTADNSADGAFMVTNSSSNYWLKLCVDQINAVTYPAQAPSVAGAWGGQAMWAPVGNIGWNNSGRWFLVQGTYRLCAEMSTAGTFSTPPGPPVHWFLDNMRITQPSTLANGWLTSGDITYGAPAPGAIAGPCPCQPTFTPSAGTGDVQITLTWGLAAPGVDLDLHVIEPSGEEVYYSHTTSTTGGRLDRDNKCSNYVDGTPENIYWPTGAAPHGSYQVKVVWYGDCSSGHGAQTYSVRIINKGNTTSFTGTCAPGATVNVTSFTVN